MVGYSRLMGFDEDGTLAVLKSHLREPHAEAAAYQVAGVYAAGGETELAFECLDRAYAASDPGLSSMMVEPLLLSLHDDPRWDVFLGKMGLVD